MNDAFPLAPTQQEILLHGALSPGTGAYLLQCRYDMRGPMDPARLWRAWQAVLRRHGMLRAAFGRRDGELAQAIHADVEVPCQAIDLRGLSSPDQEERLRDYLERDRSADFDVSQPPLMRFALFRLGETRHCLAWTVHHLIVDARALTVVNHDLLAAYQDSSLPEEAPSYRAYVDWLGTRDPHASEAYWRGRLAGVHEPTPLPGAPFGVTRAGLAPAPRWATDELRVPAAVHTELRRFAAAHDVTVNTLLQGAWAMLLARYAGEGEVVFGADRACRRSVPAALASVVGPLVNVLPVRVAVPPDAPLLPWLRELRQQWVTLRAHEHTGLRRIAAWSGLGSRTGRAGALGSAAEEASPARLFASTVNFDSRPYAATYRVTPDLTWTFDFRVDPAQPLALWGFGGEDLLLRLTHDRAVGTAVSDPPAPRDDVAQGWLRHVAALMQGMLARPEGRLAAIPMLDERERREAVLRWNRPASADPLRAPLAPAACSVATLFERQVARTPQATALEWEEDGGSQVRRLTYEQVSRRVNRLAMILHDRLAHDRLAAGPGEAGGTWESGPAPVGVMLERGPDLVCALLAALKAGAPFVALDTPCTMFVGPGGFFRAGSRPATAG